MAPTICIDDDDDARKLRHRTICDNNSNNNNKNDNNNNNNNRNNKNNSNNSTNDGDDGELSSISVHNYDGKISHHRRRAGVKKFNKNLNNCLRRRINVQAIKVLKTTNTTTTTMTTTTNLLLNRYNNNLKSNESIVSPSSSTLSTIITKPFVNTNDNDLSLIPSSPSISSSSACDMNTINSSGDIDMLYSPSNSLSNIGVDYNLRNNYDGHSSAYSTMSSDNSSLNLNDFDDDNHSIISSTSSSNLCNNNFKNHFKQNNKSNINYNINDYDLLNIAVKTVNLMKRNQLLQKKLLELQIETKEFIDSVILNEK